MKYLNEAFRGRRAFDPVVIIDRENYSCGRGGDGVAQSLCEFLCSARGMLERL